MEKEMRTVVYDDELKLETYFLKGTRQPFPNHFHEYYVIGFVEDGRRMLFCQNKELILEKGAVVLFNPGDNHACKQYDDGTFYYCGFNIGVETMLELTEDVTGKRELPKFSEHVIYDAEIFSYLRSLHEMVVESADAFEKEEKICALFSVLVQKYGRFAVNDIQECRQEIEKSCEYMRQHFSEHISLNLLCQYVGVSRSTLLRAFTREKGITPYRYLETIRINEAKKLLAMGASPAETAIQTGFSDQSHFTNYFSSFIGLSPGAYREIFLEKNRRNKSHEK